MTPQDIIRMAHEASPDLTWYAANDGSSIASEDELEFLTRFACLVAAAEREACAKVAQDCNTDMADKIAAAIRARGQA